MRRRGVTSVNLTRCAQAYRNDGALRRCLALWQRATGTALAAERWELRCASAALHGWPHSHRLPLIIHETVNTVD
jgi:hypothetical protein